jgi:hypothetical protein
MNKITFTSNISKPTYVHLLFFVTMITNCLLYHTFALLKVEICICGVFNIAFLFYNVECEKIMVESWSTCELLDTFSIARRSTIFFNVHILCAHNEHNISIA